MASWLGTSLSPRRPPRPSSPPPRLRSACHCPTPARPSCVGSLRSAGKRTQPPGRASLPSASGCWRRLLVWQLLRSSTRRSAAACRPRKQMCPAHWTPALQDPAAGQAAAMRAAAACCGWWEQRQRRQWAATSWRRHRSRPMRQALAAAAAAAGIAVMVAAAAAAADDD